MASHLKHERDRPFRVSMDDDAEIITIQGINYCYSLFDALAFGAKGSRFEIGERGDGVVALLTLPLAGQR